jgi:predicted nucleic acid-binding Zn ribbon protein
MPQVAHDQFDDDDDDYRDDPLESDQDPTDEYGGDDVETVPCPYCGKSIAEGAEICPHCRSFISFEDAPRSRQARWILLGVALCFLAVIVWVFLH